MGHPRADGIELLRTGIGRRGTPRRVPIADGVRSFRTSAMRDAVFASGGDGRCRVTVERGDPPEAC